MHLYVLFADPISAIFAANQKGDLEMEGSVDLDAKEYAPTLQLLKEINFLQGVPDEDLKSILFSLQKQSFGPKKIILFQGEIANRLFIIRRGRVTISTKNKGEKIVLAELTAPAYFGEISLLTPSSATATVTAGDEGVDALILTHDSMAQLSKKIPDIQQRIRKIIDERLASKQKAKTDQEAKEPEK